MSKWNLIVDVAKCNNCNNCVISTMDEHVDNDFPGYAAPQPRHGHYWVKLERKVRGCAPMVDVAYLPTMCGQCDNAPCVKAGGGAVYKRPDGIVIIDPIKAKGRKDLVHACPYGAIWWNDELALPQKWIFDAHLLDAGWEEPRCVQACPTQALIAVKATDAAMKATIRAQGLQVLRPELECLPHVHYRNLHLFDRAFVGGSVTASIDAVTECVEGAMVRLSRNGKVVGEQTTDAFGDFKFDGIEANGQVFTLTVEHPVFGKTSRSVTVNDSIYLGLLPIM